MDDDKEKSEFSTTWPELLDHDPDSENLYFLSSDHHHHHHHQQHNSNITFTDFTWNFHSDNDLTGTHTQIHSHFDQAESSAGVHGSTSIAEVQASGGGSSAQGGGGEPSVSSSSSEDPLADKASGDAGKQPEIPSKGKKKAQQRVRQPRFAFMTKSEVDHLEDGYRWRKYGQKAVKNSPYPRSYYRCTNSKCTVKKRVERSYEDPTIVITTYEGQHCHHSVGFPRGGVIGHESAFAGHFTPPASQFYYPGYSMVRENSLHTNYSEPGTNYVAAHESHVVSDSTPQFSTDQGLLGDIVPPRMRNT